MSIGDLGRHPFSEELQSSAARLRNTVGEILSSEAGKSLSSAEDLANKARQFSKQTLDDVSSMFAASESSQEPNNYLVQLQDAVQSFLAQKNGPTTDQLDTTNQSADSESLRPQEDVLRSEEKTQPSSVIDRAYEDIEIIYMEQENVSLQRDRSGLVDLSDESVFRKFAVTLESTDTAAEIQRKEGDACNQTTAVEKSLSPPLDNGLETRDDSEPEEQLVVGAKESSSVTKTSNNSVAFPLRDGVPENEKLTFVPEILERGRSSVGDTTDKPLANVQLEPFLIRSSSQKQSSQQVEAMILMGNPEGTLPTASAD